MDLDLIKAKVKRRELSFSNHGEEGRIDEGPIHLVTGWRGENIVIITVYVPQMPYFRDPWTRAE